MTIPLTLSFRDELDVNSARVALDSALDALDSAMDDLVPQSLTGDDVGHAVAECRAAIKTLRAIQRRHEKRVQARQRRGSLLEG